MAALLPGDVIPFPSNEIFSPSLLPSSTPSTTTLTALKAGIPSSSGILAHHLLPSNTPLIALIQAQNPSVYTLSVPNMSLSTTFTLPVESFPSASRRHRPQLLPDTPVLVTTTVPSTSPTVTCTCIYPGDSDWASGQVVLGELKGGLLIPVPHLPLAQLLSGEALKHVTKSLPPYELAAGANGIVWVKGNERELNYLLRRWRGGVISEKDVKEAKKMFKI